MEFSRRTHVAVRARAASKHCLRRGLHGRATLGLAQVVVVPAAFTWVLTNHFGKQRSVFGGAVRAYLPGFSADASPYAHRLALPDHISSAEGAAQCVSWLRWLAAAESIRRTRLGIDVLAFATIRNASLEFRQQA
jgi:hypothetical protein